MYLSQIEENATEVSLIPKMVLTNSNSSRRTQWSLPFAQDEMSITVE